MNFFKKLIFKSLFEDDFTDPNKAYANLSKSNTTFSTNYGFGTFSYGTKDFKKFIEEGFVKNPNVYSVTSRIAQNFSRAEWVVKRKFADGSSEVVMDSGLNDVLRCPNQLQTWAEFQESACLYYLLTGNIYVNGTKATGFGDAYREISLLPPQITSPIVGDMVNPVKGYEMLSTPIQRFEFDEVLHMRYHDPRIIGLETLIGLSPLETAMYVYSANNQQWEAMASILQNKGAMGIVTNRTERGLRAEDVEQMKQQYKKSFGGSENFGTPMFTTANVDFIQMGMSATDLQLLEQGVLSLRAICNIYKVSSRLFNDPANSTYNNVQQAEKGMWNDAIIPLLNKFKQGYNAWLVPAFGDDLYLDYDLSEVDSLQADAKTRAETSKIHADSGNISVNEYRKMNGLDLIDDPQANNIPNLTEGLEMKSISLKLETKQSYNDYPQQAVENAKRGIRLNEEVGNECATAVGKQRGQDIANRRPLSYDVIKRTFSYLSRAEEYYNPDDTEACGTISYLLWGGKAMKSWAERKIEEIESGED